MYNKALYLVSALGACAVGDLETRHDIITTVGLLPGDGGICGVSLEILSGACVLLLMLILAPRALLVVRVVFVAVILPLSFGVRSCLAGGGFSLSGGLVLLGSCSLLGSKSLL